VTVRAAGCVVYRPGQNGGLEVLLVHRPRYDDWSLPKGKAERHESDEDCARREVEEETGFRGELGPELGSTEYRDARGQRKRVRYWAMRPLDGHFQPRREVDEVRWLPLDEAERTLSWKRDLPVLRSLEEALRRSSS
jgi:8-oxo-dGTP diphosphatase